MANVREVVETVTLLYDQHKKEGSIPLCSRTFPDHLPTLREDVILVWLNVPSNPDDKEIFEKLQKLNKHARMFADIHLYGDFTRAVKDEKNIFDHSTYIISTSILL